MKSRLNKLLITSDWSDPSEPTSDDIIKEVKEELHSPESEDESDALWDSLDNNTKELVAAKRSKSDADEPISAENAVKKKSKKRKVV